RWVLRCRRLPNGKAAQRPRGSAGRGGGPRSWPGRSRPVATCPVSTGVQVLPVVWWCLQSCQELLDLVHADGALVGTDEDVESLAVTVKAERRNRCHSGCCDRFGIGIGIDLDDLDSSFVFVGELIEYRCD